MSLENIFAYNTFITEKEIRENIDNAIKNKDYPLLNNASFIGESDLEIHEKSAWKNMCLSSAGHVIKCFRDSWVY